jgi:hypothetical protein
MNEDPIVAEVRRIREERASRFDYDVHKIFADLMTRKTEHALAWKMPANGRKLSLLRMR